MTLSQIDIDDAPAYGHIGSAPFWCWGYESGVNEHRVAIGNEALFTRPLRSAVEAVHRGEDPQPGILGMELVRLGLERAATAAEAVEVITGLLEQHGQWGSGKFGEPASTGAYDNSFLIADPSEAWIVETAGRQWAARRADDTDSISNESSIRSQPDRLSAGAEELAVAHGWPADRVLDFAAAFTDPLVPLQVSHIRRARSAELLQRARAAGGVDVTAMRAVLRDHLEDSFLGGPYFDAANPDFLTLCMHEAPSDFTWGNTASSLIAELPADPNELAVIWWGAATPCTTTYIPMFTEAVVPSDMTLPVELPTAPPESFSQARLIESSFWWRTQRVLDSARHSGHFAQVQEALRTRLTPVEADLDGRVRELRDDWRTDPGGAELVRRASALTAQAMRFIDQASRAALKDAGVELRADSRWDQKS